MKLNGAQIIIEQLIKHGVKTVYGYPGGAVLPLYDELYKYSDKIDHVLTAHEQGAAHAADGYARASGKTGVVIATSGPGATNLVTGIANAFLDSVPMVAITGNVPVSLLGKDSFQEVDIMGITQPVVKHNFVVREISDLEFILDEAFRIANEGRKGPVLVDIPKNIQIEEIEYKAVPVAPINNEHPNFSIDKAIKAIKNSKKPFIYAGGGICRSGAEEKLLEFSKKINAPVGLSMMGLSALPADYELNLGMCGMHGNFAASMAQDQCDLMIALGVRFSDRATGDISHYKSNKTIIHVDIDIAEVGKNIDTHINVCADLYDFIDKITNECDELEHLEWIAEIEEYKIKDEIVKTQEFTPCNIISAVNAKMSDDTVVATDVGQHQMWTMLYYKFMKKKTLVTSGGLGTMGFGLGAAIGACMGNDNKRTVLFTSDGSFGMNLNEMATAVSQKLPIAIVLLNNGVLGMVRQWQKMFGGERYSQTTLNRKTDFVALSKAFGADAVRATNLKELQDALDNLTNEGPTLIECMIDLDEMVLPMIPPGKTVNDIVLREE